MATRDFFVISPVTSSADKINTTRVMCAGANVRMTQTNGELLARVGARAGLELVARCWTV